MEVQQTDKKQQLIYNNKTFCVVAHYFLLYDRDTQTLLRHTNMQPKLLLVLCILIQHAHIIHAMGRYVPPIYMKRSVAPTDTTIVTTTHLPTTVMMRVRVNINNDDRHKFYSLFLLLKGIINNT
jgi:hypothetical protein